MPGEKGPPPQRLPLLELDPDLAGALDPATAQRAAREISAGSAWLEPGPWSPRIDGDCRGALGLLVVEGLLLRELRIAGRVAAELIAAGDLIRPWQQDGEDGVVRCRVEWRVIEPVNLALLDRHFSQSVAPWPSITAEIVGRALRRSRWQGVGFAVAHLTGVDRRLLVLFWHLADRFGRVTPDGVTLRLPITHGSLAALVGARRQSVTTALGSLSEQELVERRRGPYWLLRWRGRDELERLCREEEGGTPLEAFNEVAA